MSDLLKTLQRLKMDIKKDIDDICLKAKEASASLALLKTDEKNKALLSAADSILSHKDEILEANAKDMKRAEAMGMSSGLLDRLRLNEKRIEDIAAGIRKVAELPDPVGEIIESFERPNGLQISKKRVPMGVCGIIYEARPNVTADAFAICFKSGNACVLKGGSAAIDSNTAIALAIKEGLRESGIDPDALGMIENTDRESSLWLMKKKEYIDVLIPRGSASLIETVVNNSVIPVIETGTGNCHIFVDKSADLRKAVDIIVNAKTQRVGVCNACESLVIHRDILKEAVPLIYNALNEHGVEIFADDEARAVCPAMSPAEPEDWGREYLDYKISLKTVKDIEEAIKHINRYSTGHSESIITADEKNAERFLNEIDSSCVYVNASTRFTDGGEFGFGAEIGISTQKLHARGPMGLRELTSYKYIIRGSGQIRP